MLDISRRRLVLGAVAGSLGMMEAPWARTQDDRYPSAPVKVIVPFVPGGNADSTARIFAEALAKNLGQPFVVDNRGGAGGMIGTTAAVRAEPDGYTLLCATPGPLLSAWQIAGKSAAYGLADMKPVALLTTVPNVIVVNASSPIKSMADLLREVKSHPRDMKWGHPGNGTTGHVNILQFQRALHADFIIAGYKGSGPAVQDLLGGQLDVVATDLPSAQQLVKSGRLRALGTISRQRAPSLPDVATMAELKLPEVDALNFTALMGPKQLSPQIAKRIADAVAAALSTANIRERVEAIGALPGRMASAEFEQFLGQQSSTYAALVKSGLLHAD